MPPKNSDSDDLYRRVADQYSNVCVAYVMWGNVSLLAEISSGYGVEYDVQAQLDNPAPFTLLPELVFSLPGNAPEIDVLGGYSSYILISSRMVNLLHDAGVKFEVFPTTVIDRNSKRPLAREFYIWHLQEFVEAIDLDHSTFEHNHLLLDIPQITRLALRTEFVQNSELQRPLFIDTNRRLNLFVRNDLRERLEQQEITGLKFFSLDEYRENLDVEELTVKIGGKHNRPRRTPRWKTPVQRELSDWLADPAEYGEPPISIETLHEEKSLWPLFEEEGEIDIAFHRYQMADGSSGIALTGPIIWSFGDTDMEGFSWDELKRLFAGWYIAVVSINAPNYDLDANQVEQDELAATLGASDPTFVELLDYIHVEDLMWYAYRRIVDGREEVVATDLTEQIALPQDSPYLRLPPLYYFLGSLFFEGKLS